MKQHYTKRDAIRLQNNILEGLMNIRSHDTSDPKEVIRTMKEIESKTNVSWKDSFYHKIEAILDAQRSIGPIYQRTIAEYFFLLKNEFKFHYEDVELTSLLEFTQDAITYNLENHYDYPLVFLVECQRLPDEINSFDRLNIEYLIGHSINRITLMEWDKVRVNYEGVIYEAMFLERIPMSLYSFMLLSYSTYDVEKQEWIETEILPDSLKEIENEK